MRRVAELSFQEMIPVERFLDWLDSWAIRMVHSGGLYLFSHEEMNWELTQQWVFVVRDSNRMRGRACLPLKERPAYVQASELDPQLLSGTTAQKTPEELFGYDLLSSDGSLLTQLALCWPYPNGRKRTSFGYEAPPIRGLTRPVGEPAFAIRTPALIERRVGVEEAWVWLIEHLPELRWLGDALADLRGASSMADLYWTPDHHWGVEPGASALKLHLLRGRRSAAVVVLDRAQVERAVVRMGAFEDDEEAEISWTELCFEDAEGAALYKMFLHARYDGPSALQRALN